LNRISLVLAVSLLLSTLTTIVHADDDLDLSIQKRMWAIAENLDCPVCAGQSVRESNAQLAVQMREAILVKLKAGDSDSQIMQFFADRYGRSVLRNPPREGLALAVWIVPLFVIFLGGCLVAWVLLRTDRAQPTSADLELASYEELVDDLRRTDHSS
jgi:cytochrome c-type biogenesis protein CcmH